jgi:predicted ATP-grasp superfamily ATP-dependent carboligase
VHLVLARSLAKTVTNRVTTRSDHAAGSVAAGSPPARRIAGQPSPRGGALDVVLLDADLRQAVATVRSLGSAGLRVGAFDASRHTAAAASRFSAGFGVLPDHASDAVGYLERVLDLVRAEPFPVLIAAHDGAIETLRSARAELACHAVLALAGEEALEIAVDKRRTLALAADVGVEIPRAVEVNLEADVADAVREIGLPLVVKPLRSWAGTRRVACSVVTSACEALARLRALLGAGVRTVLFQEWVPGRREAVSLLVDRGRPLVRFAQVADRMFPTVGGSSVVRHSIALPADAVTAAETLVLTAGLDGYSEVEFRRDRAGRPVLMEINPRLSASVELAVRAGIDFPLLLYRWARGLAVEPSNGYRVGARMRWLGGDVRWLLETARSQGRPDVLPLHAAAGAFVGECFRPSAYDYLRHDDLRPSVLATTKFLTRRLRKPRLTARP